jgi:hypothetical protein
MSSIKTAVLNVLKLTEAEMMKVDLMLLYQAFYALPTRVSPAMCALNGCKKLDNLNSAERDIAERIARVVQKRWPMPKIDRWQKYQQPAANDPHFEPKLRLCL